MSRRLPCKCARCAELMALHLRLVELLGREWVCDEVMNIWRRIRALEREGK